MRLDQITSTTLVQAMDIYLRHAYPDQRPSDTVCDLATVDADAPLTTALNREGVAKTAARHRPGLIQRYRWRLGNSRYPHMQLGLDRCGQADEFVFVVDTHDRNFPLGSPALDDPAFHTLLEHNERLKHTIEAGWAAAGIPTLRGHITRRLRDRCVLGGPRVKTVLIVDDDESILELERALVEEAGYRVVAASGGIEALERIRSTQPIDLCLLDIMMPSVDGLAVARRARQRLGAHFPVIYVTALPRERANDPLADDYVAKPFDPDHLLEVIRRHIG